MDSARALVEHYTGLYHILLRFYDPERKAVKNVCFLSSTLKDFPLIMLVLFIAYYTYRI